MKEIANSIKNAGPEETAEVLARALCYIAHYSSDDLQLDSDFGTVLIKRTIPAVEYTEVKWQRNFD